MTDTIIAPRYPLRRILVLLAAFAAPVIGYGQTMLQVGMTPAEFAGQANETLVVAPYTFAIWGVIYLWLFAYAIYQALPSTVETPELKALGWPSFIALAGIGLWIFIQAANMAWLSVVVILISLLALLVPMLRRPDLFKPPSAKDRSLVAWPLALLAGWLTIASVANILIFLTVEQWIPSGLEPVWAVCALLVAIGVTLAVVLRTRLWIYPVPVAWGLIGIFVGEGTDFRSLVALTGLVGAVLIVTGATLILARKDPS